MTLVAGGNRRTPGRMANAQSNIILTKGGWLGRFANAAWNPSQSLPPGVRFDKGDGYPPLSPGGFASMRTSVTTTTTASVKGIGEPAAADTLVTPTASGHLTAIYVLVGATLVTPTASGIVKGDGQITGSTNTLTGASEQSIVQAVWGAVLADDWGAGSMGERMQKMLTVAKFIGLK